MRVRRGVVINEKNNLKIILFFIILTTALTIGVILLWEKVLLKPFYAWVDARYPGIENVERRRLIQQRTEHFFISVTVDGIVVTLLLGVVRRQQRSLSESEERYRLLFEHASDSRLRERKCESGSCTARRFLHWVALPLRLRTK